MSSLSVFQVSKLRHVMQEIGKELNASSVTSGWYEKRGFWLNVRLKHFDESLELNNLNEVTNQVIAYFGLDRNAARIQVTQRKEVEIGFEEEQLTITIQPY